MNVSLLKKRTAAIKDELLVDVDYMNVDATDLFKDVIMASEIPVQMMLSAIENDRTVPRVDVLKYLMPGVMAALPADHFKGELMEQLVEGNVRKSLDELYDIIGRLRYANGDLLAKDVMNTAVGALDDLIPGASEAMRKIIRGMDPTKNVVALTLGAELVYKLVSKKLRSMLYPLFMLTNRMTTRAAEVIVGDKRGAMVHGLTPFTVGDFERLGIAKADVKAFLDGPYHPKPPRDHLIINSADITMVYDRDEENSNRAVLKIIYINVPKDRPDFDHFPVVLKYQLVLDDDGRIVDIVIPGPDVVAEAESDPDDATWIYDEHEVSYIDGEQPMGFSDIMCCGLTLNSINKIMGRKLDLSKNSDLWTKRKVENELPLLTRLLDHCRSGYVDMNDRVAELAKMADNDELPVTKYGYASLSTTFGSSDGRTTVYLYSIVQAITFLAVCLMSEHKEFEEVVSKGEITVSKKKRKKHKIDSTKRIVEFRYVPLDHTMLPELGWYKDHFGYPDLSYIL